jgi:hypothetical protein
MLKKIVLAAVAAALVVLVLPASVSAYGACHTGYTHVGPNGVYHTGQTTAYGPGGVSTTSHTGAYGAGGGSYHSGYAAGTTGYGGTYHAGYAGGTTGYGGAAVGGYHYSPTYGGSAGYAYVR